MSTYRTLLASLLLGSAALVTNAQIDTGMLDLTLASSRVSTGASAAGAALSLGATPLWHGQSGTLSASMTEPVGPSTLFAYASVGKMVTATLVLRLAEQGVLQLDQPISTYLPAGIPGAETVTVRHLLSHRSGYADVWAEPSVLALLADMDRPWQRTDLLGAVTSPTTTPGANFSYSNTNYILLSEIIERASGQSFAAYYAEQISGPLGLVNLVADPVGRDRFAQGTSRSGGSDTNYFDLATGVPTPLYGGVFGDGPVAGTAADGVVFLDALLGGDLLASASLAEMLDFGPEGYGLGIARFEIDGSEWIGHTGSWGGYTSVLLHNPDSSLTLMTVTNLEVDTGFHPASEIALNLIAAIPEPASYGLAAGIAALGCVVGFRLRARTVTVA